jgi:rod shape-determining protein MreC
VVDFFEGNRRGRRRDGAIAAGLLLGAVLLFLLPAAYQQPVRQAVRGTVLQPFLMTQAQLASRRSVATDVHELRAQRDSLAALVMAQGTLAEENRTLRALLGLGGRVESPFRTAEIVSINLPGAESTFLLALGSAAGVYVGSPVVGADGLIGMILEVDERTAVGIDWTHPDFRASALTATGDVTGIVEARRARFREEDMLVLTGAPFNVDVQPGTRIVTSGAGVIPRGIPLGTVVGIEEADAGWRKSYLLRPAMRPQSATHVLVGIRRDGAGRGDVTQLWQEPVNGTSPAAAAAPTGQAPGRGSP